RRRERRGPQSRRFTWAGIAEKSSRLKGVLQQTTPAAIAGRTAAAAPVHVWRKTSGTLDGSPVGAARRTDGGLCSLDLDVSSPSRARKSASSSPRRANDLLGMLVADVLEGRPSMLGNSSAIIPGRREAVGPQSRNVGIATFLNSGFASSTRPGMMAHTLQRPP